MTKYGKEEAIKQIKEVLFGNQEYIMHQIFLSIGNGTLESGAEGHPRIDDLFLQVFEDRYVNIVNEYRNKVEKQTCDFTFKIDKLLEELIGKGGH